MFKMKKLLSGLLALMLVVMMVPVTANAAGTTIKVGTGETITTLQEAYNAAQNGDTIQLTSNLQGNGLVVNKQITIDFGGYTYEVTGGLVGSAGTQTLCFQLLNGSGSVTLKNGKITTSIAGAKVMIMNYCDMTLENLTVHSNAPEMMYGVSNNSGNSQLIGNTSIIGNYSHFAMDICDLEAYDGGVSVTVNTTGTIQGEIEVSGNDTDSAPVLNLQNVTHNGRLDNQSAEADITVTGGAYSDQSVLNYATGEMNLVNGMWIFGSAPAAPATVFPKGCDHVMDYIITKQPTETEDGLIMYKCTKCNHATHSIKIGGHGVFLKNAAKAILNAKPGANVVIDTDRYMSFNTEVFEAIKARTDVTVTVNYVYRGAEAKENRSFTVAGGTDLTPFLGEEGFCGFEYIVYQLALAAMK